jgi:hypothetical protein
LNERFELQETRAERFVDLTAGGRAARALELARGGYIESDFVDQFLSFLASRYHL